MSEYPDKIPDGLKSIELFPFSFNAGKNARKDLQSQLELVNNRIDKIIEHFVFDDVPIVHFILKTTNQKSDLKKLAKAIDRLGDLVEIQLQLSSRLNVLNLIEADPVWFTSTFSDYTNEIDRDLNDILDN